MILIRIIEYLRARTGHLIKVCWGMLALLVVIDALPFVVDKSDAHTAAERLPGFWAVYGLIGCILISIVAKGLGRIVIQQPEDFYDD